MARKTLVGVDIYGGCGGMSIGAVMGIPQLAIRYGLDFDPHACETFRANHKDAYVDQADVASVSARRILERAQIDRIDFLLTGPTCQAVSTMGLHYAEDSRNLLFVHLVRLINEFRSLGKLPETVVLENVPGLVARSNLKLVTDLFRSFRDLGYRVAGDVVSVASLGVPQLRYRFFMFATRSDRKITFPIGEYADRAKQGHRAYRTVADAISDLYAIEPTNSDQLVHLPHNGAHTEYQRMLRSDDGRVWNHWASSIQGTNHERISHVPQGGSWKDIPRSLLPERFQRVRMTDYHTLYGRLHELNPAYTIGAQFGNVTTGCYTHPRHHRPITVREGCRLQGFPDSFRVLGPKHSQYRQIGNAVPPLAMAVLMRHWAAADSEIAGEDPRVTLGLLESGQRLPVLTPRFQSRVTDQHTTRSGYGSGTFWPKGWGKAPKVVPTVSENYRKVSDPLVYRRVAWRAKRRGEEQDAYIDRAAGLDVSIIVERMTKRRDWLVQCTNMQSAADQSKDSTIHFYELMVGLSAVLISARTRTQIITDFAYTADRVGLFLRRAAERLGIAANIASAEQLDLFDQSLRDRKVWTVEISAARSPIPERRVHAGTKVLRVFFWPFHAAEQIGLPKPLARGDLHWFPLSRTALSSLTFEGDRSHSSDAQIAAG